MRRAALLLAAPLALLCGGAAPPPAQSPDDTSCKFRKPVEEFDAYAKLPARVREFVEHQMGAMAEKNAPYNRTMAQGVNVPSRRFLRAGRQGSRWFIWFKQGGIAMTTHIYVFDWPKPMAKLREVGRRLYFAGQDPCALTEELLAD